MPTIEKGLMSGVIVSVPAIAAAVWFAPQLGWNIWQAVTAVYVVVAAATTVGVFVKG